MLGWHISVYRQRDGGSLPGTPTSGRAECIAVWQARIGGLSWLDKLVSQAKATDLGGSGYPSWYTSQAQYLLPRIIDQPPEARSVWIRGPEDIVTEDWAGRTVINREAADMCQPNEWLLVEVWDES